MSCRKPCRLCTHLAFTYSVGPSSVVWSKLGPALAFPLKRVLEVSWSRALSLVCEAAHIFLRAKVLLINPMSMLASGWVVVFIFNYENTTFPSDKCLTNCNFNMFVKSELSNYLKCYGQICRYTFNTSVFLEKYLNP